MQMPRFKGLSKTRPKKKKVLILEEAPEDGSKDEVDVAAAAEPSCSTDNKIEEVVHADPPNSPGKELRERASIRYDEAAIDMAEAGINMRKAEAKVARAERLNTERLKRWDAAQKREPPPDAVDELEKLHEYRYKLAMEYLSCAQATAAAYHAEARAHSCHLNVKTLEIDRLRRELRRYKRRECNRGSGGRK